MKKDLKTFQMHQRLNHKEIGYTAMRPFTSVKVNILQLEHLINALKFTLGSNQINSNFYIPRLTTESWETTRMLFTLFILPD